MSMISLSDLAQSFMLRRQNTDLKSDLQRLTAEMTTGQASDIGRHIGGDYAPLAGIDASLARLQGYKAATSEAGLLSGAMQTVLGTVEGMASSLGPLLLAASSAGTSTQVNAVGAEARQKLGTAVALYNTDISGRALFAGQATDGRATMDVETLLAALDTEIIGATSAVDIESRVTAWFNAPTGYASVGYLGDDPLQPMAVAPGETADLGFTAADPGIRDTLKGLAMAALLDRGALAGNLQARADLARRAGENLVNSQTARADMAARLGTAEGQIAAAGVRNSAEVSALQIARNGITDVDPYETASKLEATRQQIETLYALTARISRLSLVDFLR
jgi:flagellar hook-associated protein 3 FlgL